MWTWRRRVQYAETKCLDITTGFSPVKAARYDKPDCMTANCPRHFFTEHVEATKQLPSTRFPLIFAGIFQKNGSEQQNVHL